MSDTTRAAQGGNFPLGDRNETWDAGAAEKSYTLPDDADCYMWRVPGTDPSTKAGYKLPFASKSGSGKHAVWGAITAIAQRLSATQGVDKTAIQGKLNGYYAKARKKYNDPSIMPPWQKKSKRADMPSLQALICAWDALNDFISYEDDPDDGPDRAKAAALQTQLEAMMGVEANEDEAAETDEEPEPAMMMNSNGGMRFAVAPITHVDVRDASASHGYWTMSGYAAVFNQSTTLYDGKLVRLTESISPSAFDSVLRNQDFSSPNGVVHFNLGHDMNRSVAATDVPAGQPGSLQLRADKQGLFFLAKVPHDDPDGVAMAAKMRSGVLRQASFAFTVEKDSIEYAENDDGPATEHRTILDVKQLYDVCATPQGAYAQTAVGLRSLAAAVGQPVQGDPSHRQPQGDGTKVSPSQGDPGAQAAEAARAKIERSLQIAEAARAKRFKPRPPIT